LALFFQVGFGFRYSDLEFPGKARLWFCFFKLPLTTYAYCTSTLNVGYSILDIHWNDLSIFNSSFSILHSEFCFYIFYDRQSKKAGFFSKNLHYTAFFIDEHAVRTVRACAHSRPERSRRIYRRMNTDEREEPLF